jgi:hypothetical protein
MVIPLGHIGRYVTELCDRYTPKGNGNIGTDRTFSSLRRRCCLCVYIQDVPGGICQTAGECFLS